MDISLHEILSSYPEATVGVALRDLETGTAFEYNPDRSFHAASTMKVPVMIEVFRQAGLGRFSLDDSLAVTNEFKSIVDGSPYLLETGDDSDAEVYKRIGQSAPIRWLVDRMITVSSNLATNILIELVSADSVQATVERLGASGMKVLRGVEDLKAYERGLNNVATANGLAVLLEALATGKAVSPESDARMVDILSRQEFNDMIPAGVPDDVRVAHKTGSITEIHHDAALVYPPDRKPYVLVVLTGGVHDPARSGKLVAAISAAAYTAVMREAR